jgi:hypothetical protein
MRNRAPLAPSGEHAFDVTVHMLLNDFGPLGIAYVETDAAEADEATIIENILTGQYSCPIRVVAFNAFEGWARDLTEDIAHKVLERGESRGFGKVAQDFLERVLGVEAAVTDR